MYDNATRKRNNRGGQMSVNLKGRDFLKLIDYTPAEINYLLNLAQELKRQKLTKVETKNLNNKNVVLLFQKDSTRTRCAFEVGAYDQGANVTYLGPSGSHMGTKESIADTAKVLSRMYDGIEFRGYEHEIVEELAANSYVPVWNGLTDKWHPTQMLADYLTIIENVNKPLKQIKFGYFGDAQNNMAHSYIIIAAKLGVEMRIAAPKSLWPEAEVVELANKINQETEGKLIISENAQEMVENLDVITTDVWVSMGEDKSIWEERIKLLMPYQINANLVSKAAKDYIFLHCLPSFHDANTTVAKELIDHLNVGTNGLEVTDEIFNSKHSLVFEEAENRLHTIKAIMVATIGNI